MSGQRLIIQVIGRNHLTILLSVRRDEKTQRLAISYTAHFCKSQYHRSHHYLAVSLSLILDEAMTLDVVLSSHESVVPLTLKEYR